MNTVLIDKSNRFLPSNFSQGYLIARVEIECQNNEELMAILKHLINLDPKSLISPISPISPANHDCLITGVQKSYPDLPEENALPVPPSPETVKNDEKIAFGPISSLEID